MIDISKQYTYNGKPVRIYADGSDTDNSTIHGAYKSETSGRWVLNIFNDAELKEVWQPKEGELVWCWDDGFTLPYLRKYNKRRAIWDNCAPFTGELPEAFKGLI